MSTSAVLCRVILASSTVGLFLCLGPAGVASGRPDGCTSLDEKTLDLVVGRDDNSQSIGIQEACAAGSGVAGEIYDCTGEINGVPCFTCKSTPLPNTLAKVPNSSGGSGIEATGVNIDCTKLQRWNGSCMSGGCDNLVNTMAACKGTPAGFQLEAE
jgi:hypothetical protein